MKNGAFSDSLALLFFLSDKSPTFATNLAVMLSHNSYKDSNEVWQKKGNIPLYLLKGSYPTRL